MKSIEEVYMDGYRAGVDDARDLARRAGGVNPMMDRVDMALTKLRNGPVPVPLNLDAS